MNTYVSQFTDQLHDAIDIGQKIRLPKDFSDIHQVMVCGMGGSGVSGVYLSDLLEDTLSIPLLLNQSYFLPGFVNENTLVIISSYSGNTEETKSAMQEALKRKAKIVYVGTGGEMGALAKQSNMPEISIPTGYPPRAAFAYSLVQLFYILYKVNLLDDKQIQQLNKTASFLQNKQELIKKEAKEIASRLYDKKVVIYVSVGMNGVATRFRQQLNENSKVLAHHGVLPEMNHNEIVGWKSGSKDDLVLMLRNKDDFYRLQQRFEITKDIISQQTDVLEIWSKGQNRIEQSLYLTHLTDWVSVYLADLYGFNAIEIKNIDLLKEKLANLQ